jgi:hypothetical protein
LSAEANKLPAIHIAGNDGVTFKRVPPKSFVRPRKPESRSLQIFRDPQGLRRPRFSFFIFTCQTARGSKTPLPLAGSLSSSPKRSKEAFRRSHSTTNDNRFPPAVDSLISVRSLQARTNALAEGQCIAALSGRFISPPHRRCQRLMSTNRRIGSRILRRPQALFF